MTFTVPPYLTNILPRMNIFHSRLHEKKKREIENDRRNVRELNAFFFSSSVAFPPRRDNNTKSNFHMMPSELTPPPPLSSHPVPSWRKNFHFMSTFSALLCIFLSDICVFHMAEREKRRRCMAHERREKRGKKPGANFPFFSYPHTHAPPDCCFFAIYLSSGRSFSYMFFGALFSHSRTMSAQHKKSVSKRSDKVFFCAAADVAEQPMKNSVNTQRK